MKPVELYDRLRPTIEKLRVTQEDRTCRIVLVTEPDHIAVVDDATLAAHATNPANLRAVMEQIASIRTSPRAMAVVVLADGFAVGAIEPLVN